MKVDSDSMPRAVARLRTDAALGAATQGVLVLVSLVALIVMIAAGDGGWGWIVPVTVLAAAGLALAWRAQRTIDLAARVHREREHFFVSVLDACRQPVSVADIDDVPGSTGGRWLLVNKPVREAFGKPMSEFLGRTCNEWGAAICDTVDCGRSALLSGRPETTFAQDFGSGTQHFRVRTTAIPDLDGAPAYTVEWVDPNEEVAVRLRTASQRAIGLSAASAGSVDELSGSASQVAEAAEELSGSIAEMVRRTGSAAGSAEGARRVTSATASGARALAEALVRLAQDSEAVDGISRSVAEIAEQTNLLALNATIEAARAGNAGRGFAVVASEVKDLAQQSQHATERISASLAALREGIRRQATDVVNISESMAGAGERVAEVHAAITEIADAIRTQDGAVRAIAGSAADAARATEAASRSVAETVAAVREAGAVA